MTDKFERYVLACLLRPIVGGNPVLDGIIKDAVDFVLHFEEPKSAGEKEKKVEEPAIEPTVKTDVVGS